MIEERKKHCLDGCSRLKFTVIPANRPQVYDANYWAQAAAVGEVCGEGNCGHIKVSAQYLIPLGVYTLWLLTERGYYPAAPIGAVYTSDGSEPNRLVVNSKGILNYYLAHLDYNPFKGVPLPGGIASIQSIAITINVDQTTCGTSSGALGVDSFDQLTAQLCLPRFAD